MREPTYIALGEDERLVKHLRRAMPAARIVSVSCLDNLSLVANGNDLCILIDPRSVRPCCLNEIKKLARRRPPGVDALISGELPRGSVPFRRTHRQAWRRRARVLADCSRGRIARLFTALAKSHDRERYTVQAAATTLHVTPRNLHRLVLRATGYPPAVLLGLVRAASLAGTIVSSRLSIARIASLHGFPDQSTMIRLFKRYAGLSPAQYRKLRFPDDDRKRQSFCPKTSVDLSPSST